MRLADLVFPESTTNEKDGELGQDDGTVDGGGHLLGALDAKADMTAKVTNGHETLETSILTGMSLLLNRHDLEDLVLEGGTEEEVDDLKFFDGQRDSS
jgi:hypothetical protein